MLHFLFSRQHLPLVIGLCAGIVLGLFITPLFEDDCTNLINFSPFESLALQETSSRVSQFIRQNSQEDYEPRINLKGKPQSAKKEPQALIRPRYFSTELNVKNKLFIAVLSTIKSLHTLGPVINTSLAGQINTKMLFFVDVSSGEKLNLQTLPIIGFMDNDQGFLSLHTLKYLSDKFVKSYSFFLLVKDTTFVNSKKISEILNRVSVSENLYMGQIVKGESTSLDVCSLDAGILLSASVLQNMSSTLEECSRQVAFDSDDEKIGRCVFGATNVTCKSSIEDQVYESYQLPATLELDQEVNLSRNTAVKISSVFPVKDPATYYLLDKKFCEAALLDIDTKIEELQNSIQRLAPETPGGGASVTWPIGFPPPSKPASRFDVIRWEFFNQSHIFLDSDHNVIRKLQGVNLEDVQEIVSLGVDHVVKEENDLKFLRLENGYRRFDPTRGMDYILDLVFQDENSNRIRRHLELCRPISHVDTVPMPYVTEIARINVVLPIWDLSHLTALDTFLQHFASNFMAKSDNVELHVVLLNVTQDLVAELKSTGQRFNNLYKKEGSKITFHSYQPPTTAQAESAAFFAVDYLAGKLSSESLIFSCSVHSELHAEFLNRVRINTIAGWQVFSPIPFADYNPKVAFPNGKKPEENIIATNSGFFDSSFTDFLSFYISDYLNARKTIEEEFPNAYIKSVYDTFIAYRKLHVLRGVEPLLRLHYHQRICKNKICERGFLQSQGTRSQLAKLVLEQQQLTN